MNFAPEEREAYEEHLKWLRMETSTLKKHETKWFEDGKAEEKKDIARKMLQEGIDAQKISKITGLSVNEIKSI